ncbi:S1/P1 nuclease [Sphingomonas ginsenosidivorax]|uniref:S1/P1 nuclease n=1 Tax=Sphingomonas ginsenosidivorax TaxID=862135 RepID=A0A5C6UKL9_9SPHN|nr:S1/P1 nuclease [Sphingomonas ginsenosidivorax]TXC72038.1 S1/P1 nuclease [Sphingomonas ginsenosidivorax]
MLRIALPAALLALVAASPARAFWEYGHQTVAQIAQANVTPRTRAAIRRILSQQALLETPECPVGTIEDASVWADCVKPLKDAAGKSRFGYAYSWHYQNADVCAPFDLTPACKDGNCVSAQIERDVTLLRDKATPARARVEALVFLIHFVGDLHQPLHAGDRHDKGGNDLKADYGIYAPPRFNLHSIWDGPLAERAISTPPSLVRRYPAAERARIGKGTVTDWSRESWEIAHSAYAAAIGGDGCGPVPARAALDEATIEKMAPVSREEVRRGGIRLAKLLDEALG